VNQSERLRFPRGVRLARREDIPKCTDEILKAIADVDIRTGFLVKSTNDTLVQLRLSKVDTLSFIDEYLSIRE
jgi:hypothetical protein